MTVWSEFQPLKSVVLGTVFPTDEILENLNLKPRWQAPFKHIVDKAILEFENIEKTLIGLGIDVKRPEIYAMAANNEFSVPPIAPRDFFLVYGNSCIEGNEAIKINQRRVTSARHAYTDLSLTTMPTEDVWTDGSFGDLEHHTVPRPYLHTANILRCGNDILISKNLGRTGNAQGLSFFINWIKNINPNVKFHYVDCDEHLDGSIFLVRPGLMLSSIDKSKLPRFFKNWTVISVTEPVNNKVIYKEMYAHSYKKLNPIIAEKYSWFLQCEPEETLFSMNALSIDENTVVFPGVYHTLFRDLEKHNVECISVDMRGISFWDSGLHCCTSEIHREGDLEDYS